MNDVKQKNGRVAVAGDEVHRPIGRPGGGVVLLPAETGHLRLVIQFVALAVRFLDVSVALFFQVLQKLVVLPVRRVSPPIAHIR